MRVTWRCRLGRWWCSAGSGGDHATILAALIRAAPQLAEWMRSEETWLPFDKQGLQEPGFSSPDQLRALERIDLLSCARSDQVLTYR